MLDKLVNKNSQEYLEYLRSKRKPLLNAFDIHKTNISYGVETETEEEREIIVNWYHLVLDLNEEAINNPPQGIKRHL